MVLGLVVSVVAGGLIADPPFSVLGALVLVAATIVFAVSASWTMRQDWDASSWPQSRYSDGNVPIEVVRKRLRRSVILQCMLVPLLIGSGVWQALTGGLGWVNAAWGVFLLISAAGRLRRFTAEMDAPADGFPGGRTLPGPSPEEELPRGSPRAWYFVAASGVLLIVVSAALAGSGVDGEGPLATAVVGLGALGLPATVVGLGIAITKERAIAAHQRDEDGEARG